MQIVCLSLYAQKDNSITVSVFDNYISGSQVEIKTTFHPLSSLVGINFGISTDLSSLESDHTIKAGVVFDLYRKDKFSIDIGTRLVFERFYSDQFNSVKFVYNFDFPIDIKYDILPRFCLSLTVIPTWNRHFNYNNSVALSYSAGLGYYF